MESGDLAYLDEARSGHVTNANDGLPLATFQGQDAAPLQVVVPIDEAGLTLEQMSLGSLGTLQRKQRQRKRTHTIFNKGF
jgi:hypothetical protein